MPTRAEFVAEARSWIGVPWKHRGTDRNGIDCGQYIAAVARALGIADVNVSGYGRRPQRAKPGEFVGHFIKSGCRMKTHDQLQPADLLVLHLDKYDYPFHIGIFTGGTGDGQILHAYAEKPWVEVVEMPFIGYLRDSWTHCLQVPGLSD